MNVKKFSIFVVLLISSQSWAETPQGVPDKLFSITLGGMYDIGNLEMNDFGNIPVKKATGMNRFLGNGIHFYFQPKAEHKVFEYVEKRENPNDKYFKTSFRLYLLPVIPLTIKTAEQLDNEKLKWEVAVIEWSTEPKKKDDAYYWAIDLCKTFSVDIPVKPELTDNYESKLYECTFTTGAREFKVSSSYSMSVSLSYKRDVFDKKNESVNRIIRKLQAKEIRPY
jgi:hypothetical protein